MFLAKVIRMRHHFLASDVHKNGKGIACSYCNEPLTDVKSVFSGGFHYKVTKCPKCGKKLWKKVSFHGTGHDNFSLEDML